MRRNLTMNREYMNQQRPRHIIISGGGTGGHIFPAISIANALKSADPTAEILFVGAEGRMEMDLVPAAGYRITGLPITGLKRHRVWENAGVMVRLVKSIAMARKIIREFRPDVVVGVGGYASGPVLWAAGRMRIPTLIQEQNSYAGITNRLLAGKAERICVAYRGMEKYFPASKIMLTGNPLRSSYSGLEDLAGEAVSYFNLEKGRPVVLVLGGSLGAGSINDTVTVSADRIRAGGLQWIWQAGKHYFEKVTSRVVTAELNYVKVKSFIDRMDLAYAAADIIVSRSGAGTISELCLVGKPVVLVPSPNVAEDHQTRNAMALVHEDAAVMLRDDEVASRLPDLVLQLSANVSRRRQLSENIRKLALPGSADTIAAEVIRMSGK